LKVIIGVGQLFQAVLGHVSLNINQNRTNAGYHPVYDWICAGIEVNILATAILRFAGIFKTDV
jgi:hypothetical protein